MARKRHKNGRPTILTPTPTKNEEWLGGFRVKEVGELNQTTPNNKTRQTINTKVIIFKPDTSAKNNTHHSKADYQQLNRTLGFPYTHMWLENLKNRKEILKLTSGRKIKTASRHIDRLPFYSTRKIAERKAPNSQENLNITKILLPSTHVSDRDLKKRKLRIDFILKRSRRSLSWFRRGEGKFGDSDSTIDRQRKRMNAEPWTVNF